MAENIGSENIEKLGKYIKDREDLLDAPDIASMQDINRFWTRVMNDETQSMRARLKASELRARAAGGFMDKTEVKLDASPVVFISGEDEIAE